MTKPLLIASLLPVLASQASAISIVVDFDTHASTFFNSATNPNGAAARAAVQQAADDLSAAITTNLNALPSNRVQTGTSGGTTVTFTNTYTYANPNNSSTTETFTGGLAANEFRVFVGAQTLSGDTVGRGGPGGVGFTVGGSGFASEAQAASDIASANTTAVNGRGGAVISSSFNGSFDASFNNATYSTSFAPSIGNLWFDNRSSTNWNYDHTATSFTGTDLYTVALHEILHAIGIGTANAWNANVSGSDWTGAEVIALRGSGVGLIDADGAHIENNIMSARLSDGVMQEVVMDPSLTTNSRKELTQLDIAFLRDLGWETAVVPEPSSTLLFGIGSFAFILRRKK